MYQYGRTSSDNMTHHPSHCPHMLYAGRDGIDPITHAQVQHTLVDFQTTMWSFENCKVTFDHPYTVKTITLGKDSYMYSYLKLLPGMYICTVKSKDRANCRLEIIQREKDDDDRDSNNWKNRVLHRHGCLCAHTTDLKLLNTGDTDVELRVIFDPYTDLREPSFLNMEVRSRQRIAMPMKSNIHSGLYKPRPLRYGSLDVHKILKKVHYVINWLETLDENINHILRMISDPLWDIDETTSTFDYSHYMQEIQNALSINLPNTFLAKSFCFSVFLFDGVKIPLMSNTLVNELTCCINMKTVNKHKMIAVLRHSLKYINFMMVEYMEFQQCVKEKLIAFKNEKEYAWNVVKVHV